jgi:hypothetical protein
LSISEKSSKIKFLEKFQKNLFKFFYVKNGAERHLGDLRGTYHATSQPAGVAQPWPHPPTVMGAPWPLTYLFLPSSFSLPKNNDTPAQTHVLAALLLDFSISLLSPSLLLRFGAFVLRYVTPSIIQVEFCLVEYLLSILAL